MQGVELSNSGSVNVGELIEHARLNPVRVAGIALCALVALFDGFDLQIIGLAAPSIAATRHIMTGALGVVFSAAVAGLALGSLGLAPWADRFGRKGVLVIAVLDFAVFTLVTPTAGTVTLLLLYRFLTGLGLGTAVICAVSLASELVSARRRGVIAGVLFAGFPLGGVLAGLLGSTLIAAAGWRGLFIVGGVGPLVTAALLIAVLPESLTFLIHRQAPPARIRRAMARTVPDVVIDPARLVAEVAASPVSTPVGRLFTVGQRLPTVLLWTASFVAFGVLVINSSWTPTLLAAVGLPVARTALALALFNAASVIATAAGGWLITRLGAHRVLPAAFSVTAVGIAGVGLVAPSAAGVTVMEVLVGLGLGCASSGVIALAAVTYSTAIRSMGVGWAMGVGRIGSFVGPLVVGVMAAAAWGVSSVFGVLSSACLAGAAAAVALRPTTATGIADGAAAGVQRLSAAPEHDPGAAR
jgi:MFS transporter, AAHS family, 4-hydroxybenzoate transporter